MAFLKKQSLPALTVPPLLTLTVPPPLPPYRCIHYHRGLAKVGEAAVSPLGGLQSAGHRRCAMGVLNWSQIRYQIHPDLSQMANLKSQALYARQRSYTPLFVSPQEPGDHRSPAQNFRFLCLVGSCWSIFSPSGARLKNDNEKTSKKTRKSRILASQTLPKSVRNAFIIDVPQNLHFFVEFLLILAVFGFVRFFFEVFKT